MERSPLSCLYQWVSLWLFGCAVVLRLFLPGLSVEMGENALVWLFAWAAALFTVVDALFCPKWHFRKTELTIAIVAWILLGFLSFFWAGDKIQAIYQNMIWLSDLLLFFTLCYWAKEKGILKFFVSLLLSCFMLEVCYSIYQYFIGLPAMRAYIYANPDTIKEIDLPKYMENFFQTKLRIPHVFGHFTLTNSLGGYCIMYLPLLILLLFQEKKGRKMVFFLVLLSLAALAMTASRGSILSLVVSFGLWGFTICLKMSPRKLVFSLVFLLASLIFYVLARHTAYLDFIGKNSLSFVMRIAYWEAGFKILADHPLSGVGVGNFKHHYYTYKHPWAEEVNKVHNGYLEWGIETGILGILVLLFLVWQIFSSLKKTAHPPENEGNSRLFPGLFWSIAFFSILLLGMLERSFEVDSLQYWLSSSISKGKTLEIFLPYGIGIASFVILVFFYNFFYKMSFACLSTGLKLGMLAFFLHNFIDIDFYEPTLSQNFWIFLGLAVCLSHKGEKSYTVPVAWKILSCISVLSVLFWLSFYTMPSLIKFMHLKRSILYLENSLQSTPDKAEREKMAMQYSEELEQAIALFPWDDKLQILQAKKNFQDARSFVMKQNRRNISPEHLKKFLENTMESLEKVTRYKPKSVAFYYASIFLFQEEAKIWQHLNIRDEQKKAEQKAGESMQRLLEIYPQKILFLMMAGNMAEQEGDNRKALEYYKKALYISDLDPNDISIFERENLMKRIVSIRSTP